MDSLQQQIEESNGRRMFFYKAFRVISFNQITGDYAEFGSHGGTTFRLAFLESRGFRHRCHMWAFDSFEGLPATPDQRDEHPRWVGGHMSTSLETFKRMARSHGVPESEYTTVPGFYEDTLKPGAAGSSGPEDICLAYVDCDLYSSSKSVFEFLLPRLKHGMILACDDYYCYSATQPSGERRAFDELTKVAPNFHFLPFCQFGWHGMSFIVESRAHPNEFLPPGISF